MMFMYVIAAWVPRSSLVTKAAFPGHILLRAHATRSLVLACHHARCPALSSVHGLWVLELLLILMLYPRNSRQDPRRHQALPQICRASRSLLPLATVIWGPGKWVPAMGCK